MSLELDYEGGESSPIERLPQELVDLIVAHLFPTTARNQGQLLLINRAFYRAALPHVYQRPHISSGNLQKFSDVVTARGSVLGEYIIVLDLRRVIHGAKASQMSRLVRRSGKNLTEFHAPQVGFAQSAFRAIGLCARITKLDLHAVCEKVELSYLLAAISKARTLRYVAFPRFSKHTQDPDGSIGSPLHVNWPSQLEELRLSGAITDDFLKSCPVPDSLTKMTFENCPALSSDGIHYFLGHHGHRLTSFAALYPLPIPSDSLDTLLLQCPHLERFEGYVDYFTRTLFTCIPMHHPLHTLVLDSAGGLLNRENKISADDVSTAILDGRLSNLRQVSWSLRIGWRSDRSDVRDLGDLLADVDNAEGDDFI